MNFNFNTKPVEQSLVPGTYSQDWFTMYMEPWGLLLVPYIGRPHLRVLEIGSFEGMSARWLFDHILTDPTSRMTCIDTFEGGSEHKIFGKTTVNAQEMLERFKANLVPYLERIDLHVGDSGKELLRLQNQLRAPSYHLVYIDGSHEPEDVFFDAWVSWQLLRAGGIMIFDDYPWFYRHPGTLSLVGPKAGIEKFLALTEGQYELLEKEYQVKLRKKG